MEVELAKNFDIEVAQRNPQGGPRTGRLHGHSLRVHVICKGETEPMYDWLVDYGDISAAFGPVMKRIDHRLLNDVLGMDAVTLGDVEDWIYKQLVPSIASLDRVRIHIRGDNAFVPVELAADGVLDLPGRLGFTFEAAHYLPNLPDDHKCKRMHGHSFRVEAGGYNLEELVPALEYLYGQLDHQCLNEIEGMKNATSEVLAHWIWQQLKTKSGNLQTVTVQETCTARCTYRGR